MDTKRRAPVFWLDQRCPKCGHVAPTVYTPDLLKGPVNRECGSINNPLRRNSQCLFNWDVAVDNDKKDRIRALMKLEDETLALVQTVEVNRKTLGHKY